MLQKINLEKVLVLDIETVPTHPAYSKLDPKMQNLWDQKAKWLAKNGESTESLYERAGIYSEFGKIICISTGSFLSEYQGVIFETRSFSGHNELELLSEFEEFIITDAKTRPIFAGHNLQEFDIPYIARRMLINGLSLPPVLDLAGLKPWQIHHLDTMQLWKFGDFKHYTSLELLAEIFSIPTPKDDIKGSDVWRVYWEDHDLERIIAYCEKDVVTVAQLLLRFRGQSLLNSDQIRILS
ncbi:MAG: ribonuclease H-like domain-containing protein [Bacteroidetes bacterium]|nr:ribonuclease H-like domain-containing protein [Bacteroidota bacterium]